MSNELSIQFQAEFDEIIVIIERARAKAYRAVNHELISMYWDVGEYVSKKVADGGWGNSVVKEFAKYVKGG